MTGLTKVIAHVKGRAPDGTYVDLKVDDNGYLLAAPPSGPFTPHSQERRGLVKLHVVGQGINPDGNRTTLTSNKGGGLYTIPGA